jgi:protoporphyrin/coproporphyrin ferrochelatase
VINSLTVKLGVVLFQLGGPDSLQNIEPFLYNLFCDPDIIDFPFARIARQPLAKLISVSRAKHVAHHYAEIGGKSPILENTRRQATALEADLRPSFDAKVVVAMRYWQPFTNEAIAEMERFAPDEIVLLPLYPQYSKTTTGSSLNE